MKHNKLHRIAFVFFCFANPFFAFCQSDTLFPNFIDCNHGHICCRVSCPCCPESKFKSSSRDSAKIFNPFRGPNISLTNYPKNDSLTYNQYLGETIAGYTIANGWRSDTINGGFNKEMYSNPYFSSTRFEKQYKDEMVAFRYKDGKLFTGAIQDTLRVSFTPNKIAGYFYGKPYYESKELIVIFRANCVNGMIQGRGVICGLVPQYGIYNNIPLSECNFENGEIVGVCKHWDLNSIDFSINDGKIKSFESVYDYFELIKLFDVIEVTYIKGSIKWTKQTTTKRNGKIETEYQNETRK